MHSLRLGRTLTLCASVALGGCWSAHGLAVRSTVAKWDFKDGQGDWRTLDPADIEVIKNGDTVYLRLHVDKDGIGGRIYNRLDVAGASLRATMSVVAKSVTPSAVLSLQMTCQTTERKGTNYGVLLSEKGDYKVAEHWATYSKTVDVPPGTGELELSVSMSAPGGTNGSIDIQAVECALE
jgi:hypothetical protein